MGHVVEYESHPCRLLFLPSTLDRKQPSPSGLLLTLLIVEEVEDSAVSPQAHQEAAAEYKNANPTLLAASGIAVFHIKV